MARPDFLIFMSDQHNGAMTGYGGDPVVRTPNMDAIAAAGAAFHAAYTPCPLCVPARAAFLSCRMPHRNGVFTNEGHLPSELATFLHSLANAGYDTVLCGRMHMVGPDQRHGFLRRVALDFSPSHSGCGGSEKKRLLGPLMGTLGFPSSVDIAGGGDSPVLAYDRYVAQSAVNFLQEESAQPLCLVVGTYGPHHTYIAPPDLYRYYKDKVRAPQTHATPPDHDHPALQRRRRRLQPEQLRRIRAAYYGMIEEQDRLLGLVRSAWYNRLQRLGRSGIFAYTSDHGDMLGEHDLYSKRVYFDGSARIPLVLEGTGVAAGSRVDAPVSLMDIGPTLIELGAGAPIPGADGVSFAPLLQNPASTPLREVVLSEGYLPNIPDNAFYHPDQLGDGYGRMIRSGPWKLISYRNWPEEDLLFDLESDPNELRNLRAAEPALAEELHRRAWQGFDPAAVEAKQDLLVGHHRMLRDWNARAPQLVNETWFDPQATGTLPSIE